MKALNDSHQDLMYLKRKRHSLNFEELATILNSQKDHMLAAQLGKPIPDDTYNALIDWLNPIEIT